MIGCMIQMDLVGVRIEVPANTPVVMLREHEGRRRILPILIGSAEAAAIHAALEGIVPPRPLTHDLVTTLLETLNATLDKVVITEVREHTYYAELHLTHQGAPMVVSSRPSDALALTARTGSPIYAAEDLLDAAAVELADELVEQDEDELVGEFREFLEEINPEDFEA
jgi:uncharacterized protein